MPVKYAVEHTWRGTSPGVAVVGVVPKKALRRKGWLSFDMKESWVMMETAFQREEMAHAEVGRREGACLMLEAKRVVKLLSCNVGGGSGMT